jgi:phosphatidylglycerophosphatase A
MVGLFLVTAHREGHHLLDQLHQQLVVVMVEHITQTQEVLVDLVVVVVLVLEVLVLLFLVKVMQVVQQDQDHGLVVAEEVVPVVLEVTAAQTPYLPLELQVENLVATAELAFNYLPYSKIQFQE